MGHQTFTCIECGAEVSKKKSFAAKQLGIAPEGRICRTHDSVVQAQTTIARNEEVNMKRKSEQDALRRVAIEVAAEKIRVLEYAKEMKAPFFIREQLGREFGLTKSDFPTLHEILDEKGPLTDAEVINSLIVHQAVEKMQNERAAS